ncbi:Ketol-acid reductoisomerase [Hondaea fermentalgiana]|uniref:Acetohydroxy-acid reductoisomerase n=1 Tax=Hondaea fermentalgiana TaxID=2315210 RepID=A0A2R5GJ37_9STRA|nr:Ketol-acid reductoisomerase [Hondaea fermentalgiana]|eukprot:GBG30902.1 Ketol-acid reductoisomerase [Hondaea fermentalgiana]
MASRLGMRAVRLATVAQRSGALRTATRTAAPRAAAAVAAPMMQQARGLKTLNFGGSQEDVIERSDYPQSRYGNIFKDDTLCMLGYGTQGRGQALNLRDNGMPVIVGVRKDGGSWQKAIDDGWVPGTNLFDIDEALSKGTVIMYLLSDAGQMMAWDQVKPHLTPGKTLYVSHGFSVVFKEDTKVIPPTDIDVILCAPKGSGTTVRNLFLEGRGINGSVAVYQDVSGKAQERVEALGIAVGCGYLYNTTFQKETYSDLVGERGVLMGMIAGAFHAQYDVLRAKGHSPSEAFNETVEEATQSLYPLIGANGADWMFAQCSTTAQRGALDWAPRFEEALKPVFEKLYAEVENGNEARRSLDVNSRPDYKESLEKELAAIDQSEIWQAGKTVRQLRPENQ